MLAYLFPGQGSQSKGMGAELFEQFSEYTQQADSILGYSLRALCVDDAEGQLNKTQFTQPALYVVSVLTYLKTLADTKVKPDYVAGHSLGEYTALFAAEVFDFATGLRLVQKRGELMSQAQGGGMAAVIGLAQNELSSLLQEQNLTTITVANYNSYQQLVISGPKLDIENAKSVLTQHTKAHVIPLSVSGAFHSPYMLAAQQAFATYLEQFTFNTPKVPVLANVDASAYHPAVIKMNLTQQITQPVEWVKTIEYLQGKPAIEFKEVGPGSVLTGLVRRIASGQ